MTLMVGTVIYASVAPIVALGKRAPNEEAGLPELGADHTPSDSAARLASWRHPLSSPAFMRIGALAIATRFAGALLLSLVALPGPADAQDVGGAIVGIVRDASGRPLDAARVEILHEPTGYVVRAITTTVGRYAVFGLPLGGPTRVTVRRIGYRTAERTDLSLSIGSRAAVDIVLEPAEPVLDAVTIQGLSDDRAARTGGSTRVAREQIDAVPVFDRDFTGLASLSPLTGAQLSLGGQRWTSTDLRLDGAQHRNMLRAGEANGGPAAVPLDAIREFEVNTALFDVGQGRQGGGQIAAATRAGTNALEGRVFSAFRSASLAAPLDFQGRSRGAREATVQQSGLSIGGPIVRDRAHFFFAYERQDSNEPLFNGDVSTLPSQQAAGINRDSVARILTILGRRYGTDTVGTQLGRLDRSPLSQTALARVDWQMSSTAHATLRGTASRWNSPLSGGVDQTIALREARSDFRSDESQIVATITSLLGATTHHESQLAVGTSNRELVPTSPNLPRGFVQVRSVLPDGSTGNATVQFGGNRLAPDQSREWSVAWRDKLVTQVGEWLITAGTENTLTGTRTLIAESQSGLFVFPSIAALEMQTPNRFTRTVPLDGASPVTTQHVLELGAFVQGEWRPMDRVVVTTGLRWDGTRFLSAPTTNAAVDQAFGVSTGQAPSDWRQWQPRAQMVWRADAEGNDIMRLGVGRFTAQLPYYAQHNQLLYTGTSLADIDLRGGAVPAPDFTGYRAGTSPIPGLGAGGAPPPYVNVVGDFRAPATTKVVAAWEHRIMSNWNVTLSALNARTSDQYQYVDLNLRSQPSFTLDNEGNRGVWVPASTISATTGTTDVRNASANPAFARVVALSSGASGSQTSLTAESSIRLGSALSASVAYAWNRTRDNSTYGCCLARTATTFTPITDDPRNLAQAWGPSDLDTRHRVVGTVIARLPFGFTAAGRYLGASGRPFSLVVDGDINGDEANGNDLAFLFDPAAAGTDPGVAASMKRLLANPANIAAPYIASHLGAVATRNAIYTPWTHRVDLRLARPVMLGNRLRAELTVDIFNFGNLLNPSWGAQYLLPAGISSQNPVVNRIPLLRVTGFDPVARRYQYSVNETAGVLPKGGDPYQMQVGVRIGW
jgi:hypothetical protein